MVLEPSLETVNRSPLFQQMATAISDQFDRSDSDHVREVVLDLGQVLWISSEGLNALIGLHTATRQTGRTLRLVSLSETVADVFRMTRLERTFEVDLPAKEASMA